MGWVQNFPSFRSTNNCYRRDFQCVYDVFQSVTAFGRMMIEQTKQHVEQHYTIANGYKHDAKVCEPLIHDTEVCEWL